MPSITPIKQNDPRYLRLLVQHLHDAELLTLGNLEILQCKALALFCSVKCPGDLILKTYDLAQELREMKVPVIGGVHSPMERECLTILLRGSQPLIVCPARSLHGMRLPVPIENRLSKDGSCFFPPFRRRNAGILWSWQIEETDWLEL